MKLLPQSVANDQVGFVILPPMECIVPELFRDVEIDDRLYTGILSDTQRFRGSIYLNDGAILREQLNTDGRHIAPSDEESWHVLALNQAGQVCACLKFHEEVPSMTYYDLDVFHSAIAHSAQWGGKLRKAVELERFRAREQRLRFGEVGGWAIAPDRRHTKLSLESILVAYGLLKLLGGGVGLATATVKHGSSSILRRLGLLPMSSQGEDLPSYYDPHYRSEMELLRFDSRQPNPKYVKWVLQLSLQLACVPVVCAKHHVTYGTNAPERGTLKRWLPMAITGIAGATLQHPS